MIIAENVSQRLIIFTTLSLLCAVLTFSSATLSYADSNTEIHQSRVNAPHWESGENEPPRAIFWLGKVDPTTNYADVRTLYTDHTLVVAVHIIDRFLRFDDSPSINDLTQWDAVTLYLDLDGNTKNTLDENSFRFDSQYDYSISYQGNGSNWIDSNIPISMYAGWRGDGGINDDLWDKGWVVEFTIPFSSLGITTTPESSTIWGMAIAVHDRDTEISMNIPDQVWPVNLDPIFPSTWGKLHFGIPNNSHFPSPTSQETLIQHGLNNNVVPDAHVGGHTICGDPYGPDYYLQWGYANYAAYEQINIQNQWDIADWPCFSKYYITFPLDNIPHEQSLISAYLRLYMFGNAGGGEWGEPPDSYIQVLSVGEDWSESTINWNNAPLPLENISGTWVQPISSDRQYIYWEVTRAVAQAISSNQPLRLVLYSADGEYHTGKYFFSSDYSVISDRPLLQVLTGNICTPNDSACNLIFLPFTMK